jgi:hypothetical protein
LIQKHFYNKIWTSCIVDIYFTDLPTATIALSTYSVTVGGFVTLQCTVSGNPSVTTVQWTRVLNGQSQNVVTGGNTRYSGGSVNSPSLGISNVVNSDEGYYRCSATNSIGTGTSQQTFLDVAGSKWLISIWYFFRGGKLFVYFRDLKNEYQKFCVLRDKSLQ